MGNNGKYWEISPGPFIGPVEIRGKKNKKKYIFLFSLLSILWEILGNTGK
jgi:hypothetical protein